MSVGCPFKEQPISSHIRVQCLLFLEDTLRNFYVPFARQVSEPYSGRERKLLVSIIKLLTFRIEENLFKPYFSCTNSRYNFIRLLGKKNYFRLTLPPDHPFCIAARMNCLHQLADKLNCFFACQSTPCSVREGAILRRLRKIFIHQLRVTSQSDLFKGKHKLRITKEEQQELQRQKKDEQRMKHISLYRYNPLSQKYKKKKEELL